MNAIVHIHIGLLNKLLENQNITLSVDEKAIKWLTENGYDPTYGARPLKRVIQRSLQNPLAEMLLKNEIEAFSKIKVSEDKDTLTINGKKINLT